MAVATVITAISQKITKGQQQPNTWEEEKKRRPEDNKEVPHHYPLKQGASQSKKSRLRDPGMEDNPRITGKEMNVPLLLLLLLLHLLDSKQLICQKN